MADKRPYHLKAKRRMSEPFSIAPFADVNLVLDDFLARIQALLGVLPFFIVDNSGPSFLTA